MYDYISLQRQRSLPRPLGCSKQTGSQPKPLKACDASRFPREAPCRFEFFVCVLYFEFYLLLFHCLGWVFITFTINTPSVPCHRSRQTQLNMDFHKTFAFDGSKLLSWLSTTYKKDLDSTTKTFHSCLLFQASLLPAMNSTFNTTGSLNITQICLDSSNLPNFFLRGPAVPSFSVVTDGTLTFL